jgi:6-pyruvoyltetrahydropterin/6-carboxytetrahydropterin synthase
MAHSVQRYHDISCGHRVHGHESKCAHLHGHNYRITFTCKAAPDHRQLDDVGRVIDFAAVKELLCMWLEEQWDHKMLIWMHDPMLHKLMQLDPAGVVATPFNPTAENMAEYLVNVIGPSQLGGTGIRLVSCTVEETRKCSASYSR